MHIFCEVHFQFSLLAIHISGVHNVLADDLSRNRLPSFFSQMPNADRIPSLLPPSLLQELLDPNLDWTSSNCSVLLFSGHIPIHETGLQLLPQEVCRILLIFNIVSPFPVSENILHYYAAHLANRNLAPHTIKNRRESGICRSCWVSQNQEHSHFFPGYVLFKQEFRRRILKETCPRPESGCQ